MQHPPIRRVRARARTKHTATKGTLNQRGALIRGTLHRRHHTDALRKVCRPPLTRSTLTKSTLTKSTLTKSTLTKSTLTLSALTRSALDLSTAAVGGRFTVGLGTVGLLAGELGTWAGESIQKFQEIFSGLGCEDWDGEPGNFFGFEV